MVIFQEHNISGIIDQSIKPNRIHPKPGLPSLTPCHPLHFFILPLPAINLHPPLLIIRQRQPLITPRTRTDGVGVAAAGWGGVHAELAGYVARWAEGEGGDVAGEIGRVGAGGGEEVGAAVGEGDDVGAVEGFG